MKQLLYIFVLLSVVSCKKAVPQVTEFVAIKNSLRAMNEITTLAEMFDHSMKTTTVLSWYAVTNNSELVYKITPALTDLDTIIINFKDSTFCLDKRIRRGKLIWSCTDSIGSSISMATLTFENYSCNNVQLTGTLQMSQLATTALDNVNLPNSFKNIITGNIDFTLFNGQSFSVQPALERDYFKALNYYTGTLIGSDVNKENFSTEITTALKKSTPYDYSDIPAAVFYNGQYSIAQGNKSGKVWYGYNDNIDTYGFVEWQDAKFNFFLEDY